MTIRFDKREDYELLPRAAEDPRLSARSKGNRAGRLRAFLDWRVFLLGLGFLVTIVWAGIWLWGLLALLGAMF